MSYQEGDRMGREADAGDVWRDLPGGVARDGGDGSYAAIGGGRPDHLMPLDPSGPVSGHDPAAADHRPPPIADAPEHDWKHARDLIYPAFRPVGTQGLSVVSLDREALAAHGRQSHAQPLLDEGPAGLPVFYTIDAGAFDVIVNGDHLLSWGVEPSDVQDAAMRNLAAWSAEAPWTDEVSGERRLISSDTGSGWDAVRILLPEVMAHLAEELGPFGRILIGIPERHLMTAGSLRPGDEAFAELFADFVLEQSGGSDEPIDRRSFELVGGRLVEFAGLDAVGG
jgi:hypothetical protein